MADLVFATSGQAEALAAQEAQRAAALATRREYEEGAKAAKNWDSEQAKLKTGAESALRSIQTEQEKIADQIVKIQEAQEAGLIPPEEAEEGIEELRKKWVAVDAATVEAKRKTREYEEQQARVKNAAEVALGSVQTELEAIEQKIGEIEEAQEQGLVPPDEAEEGIKRLKERANELSQEVDVAGGKIQAALKKAFDPTQLIKVGLSFVGVNQVINQIKAELADIQKQIDRQAAEQEAVGKFGRQATDLYGAAMTQPFPFGGLTLAQAAAAGHLTQPFQQRVAFSESLEKGSKQTALAGNRSVLSSDDISKLEAVLADSGYSAFERKFLLLMRGTEVDRSEAIELIQMAIKDMTQQQQTIQTDYGPIAGRPLSIEQERVFPILEQMLIEMQNFNRNAETGGGGP